MVGLDISTGRFTFTDPLDSIDAVVTRESLASSLLASHCEQLTRNPPWDLLGFRNVKAADELFAGVISFRDGVLKHFTLIVQRPEFGTTWADFTREKELARQKFHNDWLVPQLGDATATFDELMGFPTWEWKFPWGKIVSGWDTKNGTTEVVVCYGDLETSNV